MLLDKNKLALGPILFLISFILLSNVGINMVSSTGNVFRIRRPLGTTTPQNNIFDDCSKSGNCSAISTSEKDNCEGFLCRNSNCIPLRLVCDAIDDCGDMSDERFCSLLTVPPAACNGFVCRNSQCIDSSYRCDSERDCDDGSDEWNCAGNSTTPRLAPYCGPIRPRPRIFGSGSVAIGEFPWIARIDVRFEGFIETVHCGGTLISEQWLITAAHCVELMLQADIKEMLIFLGAHDLNSPTETRLQTTYSEIIMHPRYNETDNWDYDYALIKLASPLTFNKRWRPICLPDWICDFKSPYSSPVVDSCSELILAGWGTTEFEARPTVMRMGRMTVRSRDVCNRYFEAKLSDAQICAGHGESSACRGDSGGPVMCSFNNRMYLTGVISWGAEGCGLKPAGSVVPSVFSRVCFVLGWIRKNIT